MLIEIRCRENVFAVWARRFLVKLFFMIFLEVNVIHLATLGAFLDIPPTIPEMGCNFRFREHFLTVITFFHGLVHFMLASL